MIWSFKDKKTERLFNRQRVKAFEEIEDRARNKLEMIEAAVLLEDLKVPPGNRLEPLEGDREGQHSIRINDQWRICFVWGDDNNAHDVEINKHYK